MEFLFSNILNAIQLSMFIFLLAAGLTLIFGLMDTLNLAHGAFYSFGAYAGWQISILTGSFFVALLVAPILIAILGGFFQAFVLRPLRNAGRSPHLDFALLTFGLLFASMGGLELVFGSGYATIQIPNLLKGSIELFGVKFPIYRFFVIFIGITVFLSLLAMLEKTPFGNTVRAGVENREMVVTMGLDIDRTFVLLFALGTGLAGLAGVIAAPIFSIYSHMAESILLITFIVVVVGGLGNFKGSFYASLMIGFIEIFTQAYAPSLQLFAVYIVLTFAMILRPQGVFSRLR